MWPLLSGNEAVMESERECESVFNMSSFCMSILILLEESHRTETQLSHMKSTIQYVNLTLKDI